MKSMQLVALAALFTGMAMSLTGCGMAEDAGRELAAKAEQSAKQLVQDTLKESIDTLNEKVDQAQKSTDTWLGKPPPASNEAAPQEAPEATKPAPPGSATTET